MPTQQNPFSPPSESTIPPTKETANWKQYGLLNIAIATALGLYVLTWFLWSKY